MKGSVVQSMPSLAKAKYFLMDDIKLFARFLDGPADGLPLIVMHGLLGS
jgi:hypothetical protein